MNIILGATGHVGSSCASALLDAGQPVTVVIRDRGKAAEWKAQGATVAIVDVCDTDGLREVFRSGRRAFLLNPPADVSTDTDVEEHRTLDCIVGALGGSGLSKIVLESTYGAQPGERVGDLSVLWDFERALGRLPITVIVQRAAYYMSNLDALIDHAREGVLPTMFTPDVMIPMVAPEDLGRAAARRLQDPDATSSVHYVEGPERYSFQDVADAFGEVLGRRVAVETTPRDRWIESYCKLGFSDAAAHAYVKMTAVSIEGGFDLPDDPERGETTLRSYISSLVAKVDQPEDSAT